MLRQIRLTILRPKVVWKRILRFLPLQLLWKLDWVCFTWRLRYFVFEILIRLLIIIISLWGGANFRDWVFVIEPWSIRDNRDPVNSLLVGIRRRLCSYKRRISRHRFLFVWVPTIVRPNVYVRVLTVVVFSVRVQWEHISSPAATTSSLLFILCLI